MVFLVVLVLIVVAFYFFMHGAQFGAMPSGKRLERIQLSPNYANGRFQNFSITPQLTEGAGMGKVLWKFIFQKNKNKEPPAALPSVKSNLLNLQPERNLLVWFGHSSYFMQIDGKTFLVDPVFSGNASPLFFTTKSFAGSDVYTVAELPAIDYLLITHDHWDHLDFKTVLALKNKVGTVITSLGVGDHLEAWGFDKNTISENDWNTEINLPGNFKVNTVTARHFAGRSLKRNNTLWSSFILTTPTKKIFIGGDSGYDKHFSIIGNQYGPFDLAILEDGQYNENWKYIHMMPEETVQAALDLKAKKLLPVHWGKFSLSVHDWDEPIKRIKKEAYQKKMPLVHPMIGELVDLNSDQLFSDWWLTVH